MFMPNYNIIKKSLFILFLFYSYCCFSLKAQDNILQGQIISEITKEPLIGATIFLKEINQGSLSDEKGFYKIEAIPSGKYTLIAYAWEHQSISYEIEITQAVEEKNIYLNAFSTNLDEVFIEGEDASSGMRTLQAVEGFGIYEAKKTEVINLNVISANLATNNARQIFSRVAGLNIWESDAAGLQLGIGARGLSPNRTSNFNTRQNGYDISADALGYPESYYTPPAEALERIEIVRGAASLQYGTQLGGMVNFVMKKGAKDKKIAFSTRQTVGSFGLFNTFNSIGGTIGKLNYYAFFQHKQGNGWRPNSRFESNTAFASLNFQASEKLKLNFDYTHMSYLAQQAGGLTDVMFEQDPRQSIRSRNWFKVNWNLFAFTLDYSFSHKTKLNLRTFGLIAGRAALGNLERITVVDLGGNRNLINDNYQNLGAELRLLHRYQFRQIPSALLIGARIYEGNTRQQQGEANDGFGADFNYLNPNNLEGSDFTFPNQNIAFFAENVLNISPKFSITPGVRFEYINTNSEGYYKQIVRDFAGNIIVDNRLDEQRDRVRSLWLFGLGFSYKPADNIEFYSNFSQNYRAITFSDLRVSNPNFVVDPEIQDESGFNADLGFRGSLGNVLHWDITAFYMAYEDRIGLLLRADQPPLFLDYRFRTNIADSRTIGLESMIEVNLIGTSPKMKNAANLTYFSNLTIVDARYINTEDNAIKNKKVELVPPILWRTGLIFSKGDFMANYQFSYTQEHFTDATNAVRSSTAVNGIIPTYYVMDLSLSYKLKDKWICEAGVNNLTDNRYFTRRAEGYPGPGIIPADGRNFYFTLGAKF